MSVLIKIFIFSNKISFFPTNFHFSTNFFSKSQFSQNLQLFNKKIDFRRQICQFLSTFAKTTIAKTLVLCEFIPFRHFCNTKRWQNDPRVTKLTKLIKKSISNTKLSTFPSENWNFRDFTTFHQKLSFPIFWHPNLNFWTFKKQVATSEVWPQEFEFLGEIERSSETSTPPRVLKIFDTNWVIEMQIWKSGVKTEVLEKKET